VNRYYELLQEQTKAAGSQEYELNKENQKKYDDFKSIIDKKNKQHIWQQHIQGQAIG
jgi:hypothetical protein